MSQRKRKEEEPLSVVARRSLLSLLKQVAFCFGTFVVLLLVTRGEPKPWMLVTLIGGDVAIVAVTTRE